MKRPTRAAPGPLSIADNHTMPSRPLPLPVNPVPDPLDRAYEPLLDEPFASAWATGVGEAAASAGGLRGRLLGRVAASRAASGVMFTARLQRLPVVDLAPGVRARTLYRAADACALRPGEPVQVRLLDLQPGARWPGPDAMHHREWLVLRGSVRLGDTELHLRDYHAASAGVASGPVASAEGALVFLRESSLPAVEGARCWTVRDADAGWPEYAPGIRRRVLWQQGGQAAMLYNAQAGASVPVHSHGHDEECLMVQGELFLDDELLQAGDYQLAPAGTGHRITATDTGVVIYAHGDLDLKFVA